MELFLISCSMVITCIENSVKGMTESFGKMGPKGRELERFREGIVAGGVMMNEGTAGDPGAEGGRERETYPES